MRSSERGKMVVVAAGCPNHGLVVLSLQRGVAPELDKIACGTAPAYFEGITRPLLFESGS
jgi:hypothetical protein